MIATQPLSPRPSSPRTRHDCLIAFLATIAALTGGCSTPRLETPEAPAKLQPPSGQLLFLETFASGAQVYECTPAADPALPAKWVFQAPDATLADSAGRIIGKHYAGPTWKLADNSQVVGEVVAKEPSPDPTSIAWLLLSAKSTSGDGALGKTLSIQRLNTQGGVVPTTPCSAGQIARQPYTARYYFYRAAP